MSLYLSVFFVFFMLSLFFRRELSFYSYLCLCIFMFIFAGLRKLGSSPDDFNYYYSLYYETSEFEYFYTWIENLNRAYFNKDIGIQFIILSFMSTAFLFVSLLKYKEIALWAVLIYMSHIYLYRDLIQIRAAVAYNIVLLVFVLIAQKKSLFKIVPLFTIASGFHVSAVFSCVALFFKKNIFTFQKYIFFLIFIIPIMHFIEPVFLFKKITPYLPEFLNAPMNAYILDDGGFTYSMGILNPTTIKTIALGLLFLYKRKSLEEYFESALFVNLYVFSSVLLIIFNDFAVFSSRLASMFSSVEIILVPAVIITSKKKWRVYLTLFFVFLYGMILALNLTHKCMLCRYSLDVI